MRRRLKLACLSSFLLSILMERLIGSRGVWRGLANLIQGALSKSFPIRFIQKAAKKMALRRLGERRGLWVVETRRWPWTKGEGGGWLSWLSDPTKAMASPFWGLRNQPGSLCKRFLKPFLLMSLCYWLVVMLWCDWKPEDCLKIAKWNEMNLESIPGCLKRLVWWLRLI